MSDQKQTGDRLRYRMYFWLMDLSLIALLISVGEELFRLATGIKYYGLTGTAELVIGLTLMNLRVFVPLLLVVAKFMRDDYAESLWKRTATVLAYAGAIGPVLFYFYALTGSLFPEGTMLRSIWYAVYSAFYDGGSGTDILDITWMIFLAL
ncbi:MAG: hypothetical protein ABJP82_12250, partial [Hyphomicrobiales bacterium]